MKNILIASILILSFSYVNAQTDVVYLKNGSIIRGIVIEQIPNQSIKLQTSDQSIFVYKMDEIEKITKEGYEMPVKAMIKPKPEWKATKYFSAAINMAIPYGGLKEINLYRGGCAAAGYSGELGYHHEFIHGFGMAGEYIYQRNEINISSLEDSYHSYYQNISSSGAWTFHEFLLGPQVFLRPTAKTHFDIYILAGIQFGGTPTVIYSASSQQYYVGQAVTFSYSRKPSGEVLFGWNFRFNITDKLHAFINTEFNMSQPEISCTYTYAGSSNSSFHEYPTQVSYYNTLNLGGGITYLLK